MPAAPAMVWFRRDLRVSDHTALHRAVSSGAPVVPVFVFDPAILGAKDTGSRRTAFLLECLQSLQANLDHLGAKLIFRKGAPDQELRSLAKETGVKKIFFNKDVEPYSRKRDEKVLKMAKEEGLEVEACDDLMIQPPGRVERAAGGPYTVFTPFCRAALAIPPHDPLPRPAKLVGVEKAKGIPLPDLRQLGLEPCDISVPAAGEKVAQQLLRDFVSKNLRRYDSVRNFPHADATSRLSPHLRFVRFPSGPSWLPPAGPGRRILRPRNISTCSFRSCFGATSTSRSSGSFPTLPRAPFAGNMTWSNGKTGRTSLPHGAKGKPDFRSWMRPCGS